MYVVINLGYHDDYIHRYVAWSMYQLIKGQYELSRLDINYQNLMRTCMNLMRTCMYVSKIDPITKISFVWWIPMKRQTSICTNVKPNTNPKMNYKLNIKNANNCLSYKNLKQSKTKHSQLWFKDKTIHLYTPTFHIYTTMKCTN